MDTLVEAIELVEEREESGLADLNDDDLGLFHEMEPENLTRRIRYNQIFSFLNSCHVYKDIEELEKVSKIVEECLFNLYKHNLLLYKFGNLRDEMCYMHRQKLLPSNL